jgi:hypothetical protein
MDLSTATAMTSLGERARPVAAAVGRPPDRSFVGLKAIRTSRQAILMLASVGASLVMVSMVAAGAVAIERMPDAACLAAGSTPCEADPMEWCKSLNGKLICIGEPN